MKITFLGTGTSQGVPIIGCDCHVCESTDLRDKRMRSSIIVETADTTLLIDASPDLRTQLLNYHNKADIDAVLITHEHRDHVGGLDDLRPIMFRQKRPMPLYAEERVVEALKCLFYYSFQEDPYPGAPQFDVHLIDDKPFSIKNTEIIPIRVWHYKMPILGFRIGNFAYITDAKRVEAEEREKLGGVETLVVGALRRRIHYSHFNLDEALDFIEKINPTQAYLTHMGHFLDTHQNLLKQLPANVKPAYDGLVLEL